MAQSIQEIISNLVTAWNSHDIDLVAKFYAANYTGNDVAQPAPHHGHAGIRSFLSRYQSAFPDSYFTLDETLIAGNRVALMWSARGTHQGALMNIPPTGRTISVRGVAILTIENDLVQRATYIWDVAGLLRAVGLLPELIDG
jgi:steroid delta-isomerase-like uncharacterized protein